MRQSSPANTKSTKSSQESLVGLATGRLKASWPIRDRSKRADPEDDNLGSDLRELVYGLRDAREFLTMLEALPGRCEGCGASSENCSNATRRICAPLAQKSGKMSSSAPPWTAGSALGAISTAWYQIGNYRHFSTPCEPEIDQEPHPKLSALPAEGRLWIPLCRSSLDAC